jgi:periplasmic protein TonB
VQSPIAAAPEPGTGSSSSAGQGGVGTGTGAGGTGAGAGRGAGAGFTPARITRKIPNSDYRRISIGRVPAGSATLRFVVTPQGRMRNCRVVRSSGDAQVDSVLCQVAERRMRFAPARDPSGRPVAQDMAYTPTWRPR